MAIFQALSRLALEQLIGGFCQGSTFKIVEQGMGTTLQALTRHFLDQGPRLTQALGCANQRAWQALETALAGEALWERCQALRYQKEQRSFAQQVRAFLDANPLAELTGKTQFRKECLRELQEARRAGLLSPGDLDLPTLLDPLGSPARFTDPEGLTHSQAQTLKEVAAEVRQAGFSSLAWFLELRPSQGAPLLPAAFLWFFRKEVETDRALWQGLDWARLGNVAAGNAQSLDGLAQVLTRHSPQLEDLLASLAGGRARVPHGALDIPREMQPQRPEVRQLGQTVLRLLTQHDLAGREMHPRDRLAIQHPEERQQVKQLVEGFRSLPPEQQARLPALGHGLGKLQFATGDLAGAQEAFGKAAAGVKDSRARAEAHHHAHLAALEQQQGAAAIAALKIAATLDPQRFEPFPFSRYEPENVLGVGGPGVTFQCRVRGQPGRVVIQVLWLDNLERSAEDLVREARLLAALRHPALVGLKECDFADARRERLFLVMDPFDGMTLTEYVARQGCLKPIELLGLASLVAGGLQAAHDRNVLHRGVRPDQVLVRREADGWRAKLINFGLTPRPNAVPATVGTAAAADYAAPEQRGRLPGVPLGVRSDVYGFGRTCCYALFQTPHPLGRHWRQLPELLANLLDGCLEERPEQRFADFATVLTRLA
jgi:hypothetical protein